MNLIRQALVSGVVFLLVLFVLYPLFSPLLQKLQNQNASQVKSATFIGVVDVQKVFLSSTQGKEQWAGFRKQLLDRQNEVKKLAANAERLRQQTQQLFQQRKLLAAQNKLVQFQKAKAQFQQAQQNATQDMQKAQVDVDKSFMNQLKIATEQVRQDEHLTMIESADPAKTLAYDPTLDVTTKVIFKLNQLFPTRSVQSSLPTSNAKAAQQ